MGSNVVFANEAVVENLRYGVDFIVFSNLRPQPPVFSEAYMGVKTTTLYNSVSKYQY